MHNFKTLFILLSCVLLNFGAFAEDGIESEDNYDPFSDYSEFTEASTEEADLNFFRNGRMLSVGGLVGYRGFTEEFSSLYTNGPMFGGYLTYFFSLRFAIQMGYLTSTHDLSIKTSTTTISSKLDISSMSLHAKYFLNTQNMTRSFAEFNPYFIAGYSYIQRTASNTGGIIRANDQANGFDFGVGGEYMFNDRKHFVGFVLMYEFVNFAGEGQFIPEPSGGGSGLTDQKQGGDTFFGFVSFGINF